MTIKHEIKKAIRKLGYDISPFTVSSNALARRKKLLESYNIDVIIDVGANKGQFAQEMRGDLRFNGRIVSFEPLSSAFEKLKEYAAKDPKWEVINCALGLVETSMEINIAGNSESSSLLDMLPAHVNAAPQSGYVAREKVEVKRLDSILDKYCSKQDRIYLKIDTQGYESEVIRGAEKSLSRIGTIQLEMSLKSLYKGDMLFGDLHTLLTEKGYSLVSIESGFSDALTGELLQVEGIYHRQ